MLRWHIITMEGTTIIMIKGVREEGLGEEGITVSAGLLLNNNYKAPFLKISKRCRRRRRRSTHD